MIHKQKKADGQAVLRESGIELLKIIAIGMVVISHVVQTLCAANPLISCQDYVMNLSVATADVQHFALILLRYLGAWGNNIFFVCSAWFLLRSSQFKKKKWFFLLVEIWVVSIVILAVTYLAIGREISVKMILYSLFPTLFANNWYLTCYLLFYPIHPYLNQFIKEQSRKSLFRISAALFTLYSVMNFIKEGLFFSSPLILWITIYFVMAYMQRYLGDFCNDWKKNVVLLLFGFLGFVGLVAVTNYLGLRFSFLQYEVLRWAATCNPFLIVMSMAMFHIARSIRFKSAAVNYVSSLSVLIYIIHENIILRTYIRPYMLNYVHTVFGYDHILLWVLIIALTVFLFALVSAAVYDHTLRNAVRKGSDWLYPIVRRAYLFVENLVFGKL